MRAIIVCLAGIASLLVTGFAEAATTPLTTLQFGAASFVEDPTRPIIYASVPNQNSVAVIDANTLQVTATIGIGSNPAGLTLSPDGSRLYVANRGSSFVGVIDTATRAALAPIPLTVAAGNPISVQYGTDNRLWVLTNNVILQIDPTTGTPTGSSLATAHVGNIRISSDRKSLYFGEYASSPSRLFKYDVSGMTPTLVWYMSTGGNGEDLQLSHDDRSIVHVQGGGNPSGYGVVPYRTADQLSLGTMYVGAYPYSFAFSPDDRIGYAGETSQFPSIQVYDLNTFLKINTIDAVGSPNALFVDNTGRYLFASGGSITQVFSTGRSVPEPSGLAVMALAGVALLRRKSVGRR